MMKPRLYKKVFLILAAVVMLTAPTQTLRAARGLRLFECQSASAASAQDNQHPPSPSVTAQASGAMEELPRS